MGWDNPFSFKGRIGLARFWLTFITVGIAGVILDYAFPIAERKVAFGSFSSITFPVPVEPITAHSSILFFIHFAIMIPLTWILAATLVKRLHDHERSGKWLLLFVGIIVGNIGLDALLSYLGLPEWLAVTVLTITLIPMCLFGIVGIFEVLLYPSRRSDHA